MTEGIKTILLSGVPGVGKTTLVRKICQKLQEDNKIDFTGFYTEEVRNNGVRVGFDVVTLSGKRGVLARETSTYTRNRPRIGKYSVNIEEFEELTLPVLSFENNGILLVIDEIGKMELISKKFQTKLRYHIGKTFILGTIPLLARQVIPTVDRLRRKISSKLFEIKEENRDCIEGDILQSIQEMMSI